MARFSWLSVCMVCTMACSDPEILGESECSDDPTTCGGAPVYTEPGFKSSGPLSLPQQVDIAPHETLAATWTTPLVLAPLSAAVSASSAMIRVQSAPDGGAWVWQPQDKARNLLRLDRAGHEVAAFSAPASYPADTVFGQLTASSTLEPVVQWSAFPSVQGEVRAVHGAYLLRDGTETVDANTKVEDLDAISIIAGPNGALRALAEAENGQPVVYEVTRDGALRWKRTVSSPPGLAPRTGVAGFKALSSRGGSSFLLWSVMDQVDSPQRAPAGSLLTMIDADGVVKWHATLQGSLTGSSMSLEALQSGGVAVIVANGGGFYIYTLDETAKSLGWWTAKPDGYHGTIPAALTSDDAGNLYIALTTGLRRAPQLTVCKLKVDDVNVPARCAALEGAAAPSVVVTDIAVTEPNRVVVAYGTSDDPSKNSDQHQWRISSLLF